MDGRIISEMNKTSLRGCPHFYGDTLYLHGQSLSQSHLKCLQFNSQLSSTSREEEDLVEAEPELRAGFPEAAHVLGHVPGEVVRGVTKLSSALHHHPVTLVELK